MLLKGLKINYWIIFIWVSAALLLQGITSCQNNQKSNNGKIAEVIVFAEADWYINRPEREQTWEGILRRIKPDSGPAGRSATSFRFTTNNTIMNVYAANAGQQLNKYVDRPITVQGKLIDLGNEGFGKELWIASIHEDDM